ncbi:MAG: dephospho-CoA kinase [Bacteroidota bacterium]
MAISVGVTGGIGSGKSTVCRIFKILGVPVFEADAVAKQLINSNAEIKSGLINLFGEDIYTKSGMVDRKKLAAIIFNDDLQLEKVNKLIHPVVRSEFQTWKNVQKTQYVIHEAAILFESGFYKMMNFTILVTAPEQLRIERVTTRDGSDAEQVKERMAKQWSDGQKRKLATIEIKNDNSELIIPQIIKFDNQLKEYGKIW